MQPSKKLVDAIRRCCSLGLPEGFSINSLRQHSQKGEELSQTRRQVEVVRDELVQRERELLSLATRIDQLMGDIRVEPASDRPQDRLTQLAKIVEERDLNLQSRPTPAGPAASQGVGPGDAPREGDERSREAVFAKNSVANEKEFHRAVDRWRHFRIATRKCAELTEKIIAILAGRIAAKNSSKPSCNLKRKDCRKFAAT